MSEKRLLLVEDEPGLQLALSDRLTAEGYAVETAGDGNLAVTRATGEPFDVIVLDVMLPGRDGFDVAKTIRAQGIQTPILMLTARSQVVDRVVGLKLGADDYLTKPFETIELLARIEALIRRAPSGPSGVSLERYQFGDIAVDVRKAEVAQKGQLLDLSAKEFQLLKYFIEHRGATISRDELLLEVEAIRPLFELRAPSGLPRNFYDVASDGQRFMIVVPDDTPSNPLTLVSNWPTLVKASR